MRLIAIILACASLGACAANTAPTQSEHALVDTNEWRQRQTAMDVQAIIAGMARAQAEAEAQSAARTAR
jgi:hypothetical protein